MPSEDGAASPDRAWDSRRARGVPAHPSPEVHGPADVRSPSRAAPPPGGPPGASGILGTRRGSQPRRARGSISADARDARGGGPSRRARRPFPPRRGRCRGRSPFPPPVPPHPRVRGPNSKRARPRIAQVEKRSSAPEDGDAASRRPRRTGGAADGAAGSAPSSVPRPPAAGSAPPGGRTAVEARASAGEARRARNAPSVDESGAKRGGQHEGGAKGRGETATRGNHREKVQASGRAGGRAGEQRSDGRDARGARREALGRLLKLEDVSEKSADCRSGCTA